MGSQVVTARRNPTDSGVRLAEVLAAMSKATDLGMGQPLDTALNVCLAAVRLGVAMALDESELHDTYCLALLRYIGCSADSHALAALAGDELSLRRDFASVDPGDRAEVGALAGRYISRPDDLADLPETMHESFSGHCEVAQRLGERIGLAPSLIACLGQLYERWDGKGQPRGVSNAEVRRPVMVVTLAQDAVVSARVGGPDTASTIVRARAGAAYAPAIAECFCDQARSILAGVDEEPTWQAVLDEEPGGRRRLDQQELDRCCQAMADFADLKSPYTLGHSAGVAQLAAGAAHRAGLTDVDTTDVRRAGLLHDLGRVGISAGIWSQDRPLSEREWEQVRLHPYYTERVLARPEALAKLGRLASQHHERMNGSGYHRGLEGRALAPAARILAAADAYQAMTEPRPHRAALSGKAAADELRSDVRAGRLDGDAVDAVLGEAGHRVPPSRRALPVGLSRREVEVLRLLARGLSNREVGGRLYIAPDTVKRHVQHIYEKTGASTRAGATLFAVENALL